MKAHRLFVFSSRGELFSHLVVRVLSQDQAGRRRVGFDGADDGVRRLVRAAWLPAVHGFEKAKEPAVRSVVVCDMVFRAFDR